MSILKAIFEMQERRGERADQELYFPELSRDVWNEWLLQDTDDLQSVNRAELMLGLYSCFFGEAPSKRPNQRRRYSAAIFSLCYFLDREGFPPALTAELRGLGESLDELDRGNRRAFLDVPKPAGNQSDPGNVWECRAIVACALDHLVSIGDRKNTAAKHLADRYAPLSDVIVRAGGTFSSAIIKWHQDLKAGSSSNLKAQGIFDRRSAIASDYRQAGFSDRTIADKMMVDAMLWGSRISDAAMARLYPEAVRRARLNRPY